MQAIIGVLFHFIGGFASGSFYIPFKKVKGWAWETYWLTGGLFSWLIMPFLIAALTVPGFTGIILHAKPETLFWTYFMGVLWGIGGLTFGLAMRYLGMSLGMSVALGFCSAFGALIPPVYADITASQGSETFSAMAWSAGGRIVLAGVGICLLGIAVCGAAGMRKERELSPGQKQASIKEFNLKKGLLVAVFSGILSACMSFAISAGKPLAETAELTGTIPIFRNNVIFVVVMLGGLTTNLIACMLMNARHKTFGDYTNPETPLTRNYFFSALAGTTWFMQYFFYGMGESKLGNGASSWILHMAFIILVSNGWGIVLKEWKGVTQRTMLTILTGIALIILSVILVGYGNSI